MRFALCLLSALFACSFAGRAHAALETGTNVGLLTSAPTGDPAGGSNTNRDGSGTAAIRCAVPANGSLLTEIGWYKYSGTASCNGEMAVFDHDGTNNRPVNRIYASGQVNFGSANDWKRITGLTLDISSYANGYIWIAWQIDAHTGSSNHYYETGQTGYYGAVDTSATTATNDPWGSTTNLANYEFGTYGVYTIAGGASVAPVIMRHNRNRRMQ